MCVIPIYFLTLSIKIKYVCVLFDKLEIKILFDELTIFYNIQKILNLKTKKYL